ncbi:MAG: SDR family NAD(P)-dependent oxidoreductase [Novosphingobium sp.]
MDLAKYGPWALVIGGSEGVGAEFARQLAADGFKLVLTARKVEPLQVLKAELQADGAEVRILSADLKQRDVLDQVRKQTDDIEVGLLVFNAGANDTRGNFVDLPAEVTDGVIAINVHGHADFSRHYGKKMCDRGRGGIILTGSTGGYLGSPTLTAYCAAKAFCRVFAEALWAECQPLGVDVLHLNIGFTATPAMARLGMPIELAEPCDSVARQGLENIANGPVWIVNSAGNVEHARRIAAFDDRGGLVRQFAIAPREDTAKAAEEARKLAEEA